MTASVCLYVLFFLSCFDVSGVMFYDFTPQTTAIYVCVNFGCRYGFVSQHHLNGTKIGAAFKQVCGKRMPESVRTDYFYNTNLICKLFNNMKDHDA